MLNVIRRLISSCTASLSLVIYCKPFWVYFKSLNIYIYAHIYTHIYIYINLFLAVLGLHCCSGFSLVVTSGGTL